MKNSISKKSILLAWGVLKPWQRILLGLLIGAITGLLLGQRAMFLQPIGTIFINAIHMMIVPVVFTAIVCAVISIGNIKKMRRICLGAMLLYFVCMGMAATIGLSVATLIAPGSGLSIQGAQDNAANLATAPTFIDLLINVVPANPISAFANENLLQILVFAVVLGISINLAGDKSKTISAFFHSFSHVIFKLAGIIMNFAPYGVFALIACVTGKFGIEALIPLLKFVGTVYLCCILHILIVYMLSLATLGRLSPITFLKGIWSALIFAFGSTSSVATLPMTMKCVEEKLGVSKGLSRFLLPLGTSINLNGLSIYLSVATVFAANLYGIHLDIAQYLIVAITIILTSMGAGGVPGSAIIVMGAVMSSVGIPLGAIPLITGVDRINDIASTVTSVAGDAYTTLMVAKNVKEFDSNIYNGSKDINKFDINSGDKSQKINEKLI